MYDKVNVEVSVLLFECFNVISISFRSDFESQSIYHPCSISYVAPIASPSASTSSEGPTRNEVPESLIAVLYNY